MCLILFGYKVHPVYKLIVAANRDEFFNRPTAPVEFWQDEPHILAGRDLEKLGTWMGITTSGRFAALTNYRNPFENTEGKQSRGKLVADFLKGSDQTETYMNQAAKHGRSYTGYNLLAGDLNELFYYSNIGKELQKLRPGIYGLSNHLLNTDWPKVKKGKAGLKEIINDSYDLEEKRIVERLFALLQDSDPAPDELLQRTGLPLERERILSPLFIKGTGYGTRCSTILLMNDQEVLYIEKSYSGGEEKDREYKFSL